MTETEMVTVEHTIKRLAGLIVALTAQRTELAQRIIELENEKARLTRLLPMEKRTQKLFE